MTSPLARLEAWAQEQGLSLDQAQWGLLERYCADVMDYGRKVNLTADLDPREVYLRHVADGLVAAKALAALFPGRPIRVLDLGSGAGFIGLPVRIALPSAHVWLMESAERKFRFLNWTCSRLALKNLKVLRKTAGQAPIPGLNGSMDAVLARALAPLPKALSLAQAFLHREGCALIYQSDPPGTHPVLKPSQDIAYRLPGQTQERHLLAFQNLPLK